MLRILRMCKGQKKWIVSRSRKMRKNEPTLAIWGFDTAENRPKEEVWCNAVTFTSHLEPRFRMLHFPHFLNWFFVRSSTRFAYLGSPTSVIGLRLMIIQTYAARCLAMHQRLFSISWVSWGQSDSSGDRHSRERISPAVWLNFFAIKSHQTTQPSAVRPWPMVRMSARRSIAEMHVYLNTRLVNLHRNAKCILRIGHSMSTRHLM